MLCEFLNNQDFFTKYNEDTKSSPIQEFYKDQTILITGATGFLGSLLVEKLLRCCPQIRKLILLFREKGSKTVEERVKDYFSDEVFDKMRLSNPNYQDKVDIVCGQLDLDSLGLNSNEERLLTSQTTIVFHVAATVRFDEHIRTAYNINVKGTETIIALAKRMPRLKSFVYVSTAYCNCDREFIDEEFYPPSFTAQELSILIGSSSDEDMAILNTHLLGMKPNTYTLTKATAEDLVREVVHELPVCVFRPSIVLPTLEEPLPLWIKGFNGVVAFLVVYAIGLLRVQLLDLNNITDIVPADRTINALTALAWYQTTKSALNHNEEGKKTSYPKTKNTKIFNYISYNDNKIAQCEFQKIAGSYLEESHESCSKQLWKRHIYVIQHEGLYFVLFYVIHLIPALVFSLAEKLTHRKPLILKIYRKMLFFHPTMSYFGLQQWKFNNSNTRSMVEAMAPQDQRQFDASMSSFRWETYLLNFHRSVAFYVLGERVTKEYYENKMVYMEWADFVVWTVVYVVAGYCSLTFLANQVNFYGGLC